MQDAKTAIEAKGKHLTGEQIAYAIRNGIHAENVDNYVVDTFKGFSGNKVKDKNDSIPHT